MVVRITGCLPPMECLEPDGTLYVRNQRPEDLKIRFELGRPDTLVVRAGTTEGFPVLLVTQLQSSRWMLPGRRSWRDSAARSAVSSRGPSRRTVPAWPTARRRPADPWTIRPPGRTSSFCRMARRAWAGHHRRGEADRTRDDGTPVASPTGYRKAAPPRANPSSPRRASRIRVGSKTLSAVLSWTSRQRRAGPSQQHRATSQGRAAGIAATAAMRSSVGHRGRPEPSVLSITSASRERS